MLQPFSRVTTAWPLRWHVHALSDEIVRRILNNLTADDLRQVVQVCARWHRLAPLAIVGERGAGSVHPSRLPWNVLRSVFALAGDCHSAARVCARWRLIALCFFSPLLGRRHINNLPGEILDHIFSYLDFESLRMAAQVCLHWRDHGIDHPIFWQNIEATAATEGALDLLAARLGQSCRRPFSLTIDIEAPLRPSAETRLMNMITSIMPTVQKLHIRLNSLCLVALWPVLNWHAPELTSFRLKLYNPDRLMALVPLNPWIFDSMPGNLRDVYIEDVLMPIKHRGLPAFSNLQLLHINHPHGTLWSFPIFIFEVCTCLYHLSLACGRLTFEEPWSAAALEGLSRLVSLDVDLSPMDRSEFVARMPLLHEIPSVILTTPPDDDAAYNFLAGVRHPFNFGLIYKNPREFCVLVEDDRSGYSRNMIEFIEPYARGTGDVNILLDNEEFPAQVRFLKVSLNLWDLLVPYMTHFASIRKLMVDLYPPDRHRVVRLGGKPLALSALDVLVLESWDREGVIVRTEDILDFVDNVLQACHCRKLDIRGRVFLKGDVASLSRRFDDITFSNRLHSRPIIRREKLSA